MDAQAQGGRQVLVIGVGNEYRRDDGVGLIVARRLKKELRHDVEVLEESGDGTALIAAWKGADAVIVIDATSSAAKPGTVHRFEPLAQPVCARFVRCSTHTMNVAEAVELSRALGGLPRQLVIYGIEGKDFEVGVGLSPEVEKAADEVLELVLQEVRRHIASPRT